MGLQNRLAPNIQIMQTPSIHHDHNDATFSQNSSLLKSFPNAAVSRRSQCHRHSQYLGQNHQHHHHRYCNHRYGQKESLWLLLNHLLNFQNAGHHYHLTGSVDETGLDQRSSGRRLNKFSHSSLQSSSSKFSTESRMSSSSSLTSQCSSFCYIHFGLLLSSATFGLGLGCLFIFSLESFSI